MFDIGGPELIMILVGILILFGPKKLPELAQGLGKGLRQFRRAQQEFNDQITSAMREEERKKNDEWKRPIEPKTVARGGAREEESAPSLPNGSATSEFGPDDNRISPAPPPPSSTSEEQKIENGSPSSSSDDPGDVEKRNSKE